MTNATEINNMSDKKQPKPFNWRHKDCGCDLEKSWTFKRNYKATVYDIDGDRYNYAIHEISDANDPQLVLFFEDYEFKYDIIERCEQLLRLLARGKVPELNETEKALIEASKDLEFSKCCFNPEMMVFVPYTDIEPK